MPPVFPDCRREAYVEQEVAAALELEAPSSTVGREAAQTALHEATSVKALTAEFETCSGARGASWAPYDTLRTGAAWGDANATPRSESLEASAHAVVATEEQSEVEH